jgi:hypothetical protein
MEKKYKPKLKYMYGWVLTYNPYREKWLAVERSNYNALWNGGNSGVIQSKTLDGIEGKIKRLSAVKIVS